MAGQHWPTIAFLIAVATVSGLSRGFSGFGAALIFIPLASAAVGPALAAPIFLAIDAVGAAPMLPGAWGRADRRTVLIMSAGALLAIPAGTIALRWIDPGTLRWGICSAILLLVALLTSGWRYTGRPKAGVTVGVGLVSGFLSGSAQIGGPPALAYWLSSTATAAVIRANMVVFFACSTVYSAVAYGVSGLFDWSMALLSLVAGPAYLGGAMLGMRMFGLASQETFRRISYTLIALAAILGLPIFR